MPFKDRAAGREWSKKYREQHKESIAIKKKAEYLRDKEKILKKQKLKNKHVGMSKSEIIKMLWSDPIYRDNMTLKHIGKKHSDEHKRKIGLKAIGNKYSLGYKRSIESIEQGIKTRKEKGFVGYWKGKKRGILLPLSDEVRKKMSDERKGVKNSNWKGGISPKNRIIRNGLAFRIWREGVFLRDNWICQKCTLRGGKLHPHHILNFADRIDLRFVIDNGITLCVKCHKKFHNKYGQRNNTKEQLNEFLLPSISILLPHLHRQNGLEKCLHSIKNLNYPQKLIEVIVLDGDDSVPLKIKKGVEQSKGEWVVFAANDMVFHSECIINALKCKKRLVSFNEGELLPDNGNICTHFMIKRDLIPLIGGEIFCTRMNHVGVDNLLWAKCEKLGEAHYCKEAKITHHHFSKGAPFDSVYEKGWKNVEQDRQILKEELAKL